MSNRIYFKPMGIAAAIEEGETILEAAQKAGVYIEAYCGSQKKCGKCRIKIVEGSFHSHGIKSLADNFYPVTDTEQRILSSDEISGNIRLACVTKAKGDIAVEIPLESRNFEGVILNSGRKKEIEIRPAVKTYYVELNKATLEDNKDDFLRLKKALRNNYNELNDNLEIDFEILKQLPKILRESNWKITATVLYNKKIINVEKGNNSNIYGVAIDIGTTTIAAYLCDLKDGEIKQTASMMNPQIPFGDDVLTRVSYCDNAENGTEELQKILIKGINELVKQMAEEERINSERVVEAVLVFNTVMQHIALGINPKYIGVSPFISAVSESVDIPARELGINMLPGGNIHCLPSEAGFIGADNVAVLIAEEPYLQEKIKLIIDIGTNSEICLGNKDKLYTTSCATGPALEGAQIKCGVRAASGAIEKVKINPITLEPELGIIGGENTQIPSGICGSGILDAVAQMAETGIIEPDGKFSGIICSNRVRCGEDGKKEYVLYFGRDENERDIVVTQKDVRAVQLAKAALYAGAKALMKRFGIAQPDEIILAGAFGTYINKANALNLGLFPDCNLDCVTAVGNAAGTGATYALINTEKRKEAQSLAKTVRFIETAVSQEYQKMFAQAMAIPHKTDGFTINQSNRWSCTGDDDRVMSQEAIELGNEAFYDVSLMEKAVLSNQKFNQSGNLVFPLMQKAEVLAYGGKPQIIGKNYIFSEYKYETLEEINKSISITDNEVIRNTLECISRNKEKNIVLEVTGPFSILGALINPVKLYKYGRKNKDTLMDILFGISDSLGDYTLKCIEAGVDIISFGDPEGVSEIVGEKFYQEISGLAAYSYLKKIEPHLDKSLVHICGKSSGSLQKSGFLRREPYRVEKEKSYMDILFECAKSTKFKFVGHGCMHAKKLTVPIISKMSLS